MANKQNLDSFLRDQLNQLPDPPVAGFEKVERKMAAEKHKGILTLALIPLLISGLVWMVNLNETDFYLKDHPTAVPESKSAILPEVSIIPAERFSDEPISSTTEANLQTEKSQNIDPVQPAIIAGADGEIPVPALAAVEPEEGSHNLMESTEPQPEYVLADEPLLSGNAVIDPIHANDEQADLEKSISGIVSRTAQTNTVATEDDFEVDVRETNPWSVTLNIYPNYTFREFSIKDGYEHMVNDRYVAIINESEKGGFAFNAGLDVRYHIGNNVFIGSGLGYIQTKVNGNYDFEIYGEASIDGAVENLAPRSMAKPIQISKGIIQTYRFLQVPLHVSYQPWASEKIRLIIEGGFSYIRFLGAEGTTIDYRTLAPKDLSTEDFNKDLAALDFKVGFTYMVSDGMGVGLEPTLMYFSGGIYPDEHPVQVVPWSVGLNINLRMRLY